LYALLPLNGLHLPIGHLHGIGQRAHLLDTLDALRPVGVKQHAKKLCHKVVEELAIFVSNRLTVGAAGNAVAYAAGAHLTPGSLFVIGTTGTFPVKQPSTSPTVKAAVGYHVFIGGNIHICHLYLVDQK
jgi:hypothetical protein